MELGQGGEMLQSGIGHSGAHQIHADDCRARVRSIEGDFALQFLDVATGLLCSGVRVGQAEETDASDNPQATMSRVIRFMGSTLSVPGVEVP